MLEWHVISLLIHGFLSVNARLLIAFGTAFYAIIRVLSFLNNPKDLDPSYKMDLDFWDCFLE